MYVACAHTRHTCPCMHTHACMRIQAAVRRSRLPTCHPTDSPRTGVTGVPAAGLGGLGGTLPTTALLVGFALTLPDKAHELRQAQVAQMLRLDQTSLGAVFEADHIETRTLADIRDALLHERVHDGGSAGSGSRDSVAPRGAAAADPPADVEAASGSPSALQRPHQTAVADCYHGQGALTRKHLRWARALLVDAVRRACCDASCALQDVRFICICTSTGFLLPGLSAYVLKDLGLPRTCQRLDIVGMGCHAGLNSVSAAASWAHTHPGQLAVACAVEVCSAQFLWTDRPADGSQAVAAGRAELINHAVVNSLFSDGAFAACLSCPRPGVAADHGAGHYVALHQFMSLTATEAIGTMEYRWHEHAHQPWFHLEEQAPYAVGAALVELFSTARDHGLPLEFARHWVMHTGGQTVIDAATAALGLDLPELESTVRALKRYGNNSSASFMFAFSEFLEHPPSAVSPGDLGVFLTMGPGAGIELGLWSAGTRAASTSYVRLSGWEPASLPQDSASSHVHRIPDPPADAEA